MDLLGGYGSDDSGSSNEKPAAPPPSKPPAAAAAAPVPKTSRRGKRIVSLHAVLPTHILDQLEKSTATGDFDSDDEDPTAAAPTVKPNAKRHSVVGKDEGLSSFLSELKSAPTTSLLGGGSAVSTSDDAKPAAVSQPLGQAFTTRTSVVVSRGDEVVDIHAQKPKASPPPVASKKPEPKVARAPAPRAAAPRPSAVSVPRPGMHRPVVSSAAPPVAPPPGQVPMQQAPYYQPEEDEEPKVDARRAKKRSRKEMEKALRQGNLDALEDSYGTTLQAEGAVYVPEEETYAVPSSGAVRVAPVRMYDPKAGTDVVQADVTGKQRGKHQINQLLASAANLELQRARGMGAGGGNTKRADAKRKYGW